MDIKKISNLFGAAKAALIDLTIGGDRAERKEALKIQQAIERNFAANIQSGAVSKNSYDARVFQATNEKLFKGNKKPVASAIPEHDLLFYEAAQEEAIRKEKELFLYIKGLAQTVKENISDDIKDENVFIEFTHLTSELEQESQVILSLFLKYYFCQQALEYINQARSLDKSLPLTDLARIMKDDLHKISFIATCDEKELKNFQKIIELPKSPSKARLAKREAYLRNKLNETITLLIASIAPQEDNAVQ